MAAASSSPPPEQSSLLGHVARKRALSKRILFIELQTAPILCAASLRAAAEWRSNKLTSSEYDETTWSARTWLTFVAQRLSVAVQLSVAQEAAEALGLSVAADPRAR